MSVVPDPVLVPDNEELPLSKIACLPLIADVVNTGELEFVALVTLILLSLHAVTVEDPVILDVSNASNQSWHPPIDRGSKDATDCEVVVGPGI